MTKIVSNIISKFLVCVRRAFVTNSANWYFHNTEPGSAILQLGLVLVMHHSNAINPGWPSSAIQSRVGWICSKISSMFLRAMALTIVTFRGISASGLGAGLDVSPSSADDSELSWVGWGTCCIIAGFIICGITCGIMKIGWGTPELFLDFLWCVRPMLPKCHN